MTIQELTSDPRFTAMERLFQSSEQATGRACVPAAMLLIDLGRWSDARDCLRGYPSATQIMRGLIVEISQCCAQQPAH